MNGGIRLVVSMMLAATLCTGTPVTAQDVTADEEAEPPPPASGAAEFEEADKGFFHQFFDEEDGKLDFSRFLAKGGFIPIPVIILIALLT